MAILNKVARGIVLGQILFSVEHSAQMLGLSQKFIRVLINRGELRARRCGTRVLIHRDELERFGKRDHAGVREKTRR